MKFIYRLSLRLKLFLLIILPIIGLTTFSFLNTLDNYNQYRNIEKIEKVAILASLLSSFTHELDLERSLTSIYIGSEGEEYKEKGLEQVQLTEATFESIVGYMDSINLTIFPESFRKNISKALKDYQNIRNNRTDIENLKISLEKALRTYTNINELIINEIVKLSELSTNSTISKDLISYANLILLKEDSGIERGVGSNAIVKDEFEFGIRARWQQLITQEDLYLRLFKNSAKEKILKSYNKLITKEVLGSVIEIRKTAITSGMTSEFGIDITDWFNVKTNMQKSLKKLENELVTELFTDIDKIKEEMLFKTSLIAVVSAVALLFTLIIAIIIINSLSSSFKIFKEGLYDFLSYTIRETNETHPIEVRGTDEFAQMTMEINNRIKLIEDVIEKDKQAVEEIDDIMGKIANGFYGYRITNIGASSEVKKLTESINTMALDSKRKFDTINAILDNYGLGNFEYRATEDDLKGMYGDFGSLLHSSRLLGRNISELLAQLSNAGNALNSNTEVLTSSSIQLAKASKKQANSLEETAGAVTEITSNIKQTSKNVVEMSNIANDVTKAASEGEDLASKTAESMDDINQKVDEISNAIKVIDQIAFQTNILSLNAAVEAATAGEAGKGFAVVAQEVRNLASRSADAANEIKALVESAHTTASQGKKISTSMINGYSNLNTIITRNKEMIEEVLKATQEQEHGIVQINSAVTQLDQVTQNNASESSKISELVKEVSILSDKLLASSDNATIDEITKRSVCNVELTNTLAARKHDHIVFMDVNFNKLGKFERWDVVDSKSCKLGKWIKESEDNNEVYTKTSNWQDLRTAHDGVHSSMQTYINKDSQRESNFELRLAAEDINVNMEKVFANIDQIKVDYCEEHYHS